MRVIRDSCFVIGFIWKHPANHRRRARQVARAVSFQLRARLLHQRVTTPIGSAGARIWVELHRTAASKALYANPPDLPEMAVWQRHLEPGELFVDVGANVGTYSVLCASLGADVIALEPAPDTAALLRENAALNGFGITVLEAAAGSFVGSVAFTMGRDCVNHVAENGEVRVPVVTLDSVIGTRSVGGLKIDVEGYELDALIGCSRTLRERRVRLIQLEWNALADRSPVRAFLHDHGYRLLSATEEGRLIDADSATPGENLFASPC